MKTSSEVRVKWFVPCGGQHYRFPAQISPYLKIKVKDECYSKLLLKFCSFLPGFGLTSFFRLS